MVRRVAVILVLLPVAELAAFGLAVWVIGFLPALGLMILTSAAGAVVLCRAGRGRVAGLGGTMGTRGMAGLAAEGDGVMLAVAGILLLLPGFITDLMGAGLLVGPIRRRIRAAIGRGWRVPRAASGAPEVIDLAPGEWQSVPEQTHPKAKQG